MASASVGSQSCGLQMAMACSISSPKSRTRGSASIPMAPYNPRDPFLSTVASAAAASPDRLLKTFHEFRHSSLSRQIHVCHFFSMVDLSMHLPLHHNEKPLQQNHWGGLPHLNHLEYGAHLGCTKAIDITSNEAAAVFNIRDGLSKEYKEANQE